MKADTETIKKVIREKFAWPGGYPMFLITSDGESLCCDCARKEYKQIFCSIKNDLSDGWKVIGHDINWEDLMVCCHCNKEIDSAYDPIEED